MARMPETKAQRKRRLEREQIAAERKRLGLSKGQHLSMRIRRAFGLPPNTDDDDAVRAMLEKEREKRANEKPLKTGQDPKKSLPQVTVDVLPKAKKAKKPVSTSKEAAEAAAETEAEIGTKRKQAQQAKDTKKAKEARAALDKISTAERKALGPITNFMEELFGLNRDKATYERDVAITRELEARDRGGMKRGGKVKKTTSKPTKKYAMNRGGKVTGLRKPSRLK